MESQSSRNQMERLIEEKRKRQKELKEKRQLRAESSMKRKSTHDDLICQSNYDTDSEHQFFRGTVEESSEVGVDLEAQLPQMAGGDDDQFEKEAPPQQYHPGNIRDQHISPQNSMKQVQTNRRFSSAISSGPPSYWDFFLFLRLIKNEFYSSDLTFNRNTSFGQVNWVRDFAVSEHKSFFSSWKAFFLLRGIFFLFVFGIWIWSIVAYAVQGYLRVWIIFFTDWTLTILAIYFGLATYTTFKSRNWKEMYGEWREIKDMPTYVSAMWFFRSLSFPATIIVVVLYWTLGYTGADALKIAEHALVLIPVLIDSFFSPTPAPLLHGVYLFIYCASYLIFNWAYYQLGGTDQFGNRYIYSKLDWGNPEVTQKLSFGAIFIGLPIFNLAYWWFSFIRKKRIIWYKTKDEKMNDKKKGKQIKKLKSKSLPLEQIVQATFYDEN
eukprot:c20084_g1_i2.p1 GENE.c20084_g1_i2~~c20084_g1_i2.p1  ORF type:complete len:437 (+),score=115.86 c20084_g1_i2:55-1365(+)